MLQIVFNVISSSELSCLKMEDQLSIIDKFKIDENTIEQSDDESFGEITRDGITLRRFRCDDYRIYFSIKDDKIMVFRILHKNTISDFAYRSNLPTSKEDEILSHSKHFWSLIKEDIAAKV